MAALPLWISACVVPISPEFQDPAGNVSPFVASSTPPAGAVLPISSGTISVTLGDTNLDDTLQARWFIDYPPYDASISRAVTAVQIPPSGQVNREPILFAPSCADDQIPAGPIWHRVTLSVADRPFLAPGESPPDLPWDSVPAEGFVVRSTWIVYLSCP